MIGIVLYLAVAAAQSSPSQTPGSNANMPAVTSFMGIPIGVPASDLQECPTKIVGAMPEYKIRGTVMYDYSSGGLPCWTGTSPGQPMGGPLVQVVPKSTNRPDGTRIVHAYVAGDMIEGVWVATTGIESQESLFSKLREQFGEPSSVQRVAIQTMMGMEATKIKATWNAPNGVTIDFNGVEDKINEGGIYVNTAAGKAAISSKIEHKSF
ncbi:hypothetical protein EIM48_10040 [Pseudoxanthomonas sp. SGNA-20]|uniref:hypothetical protein n=1 Tax=Pseudoxanthomonas sp. SGNA-20 TaxID=2493088 RepID=UPI000F637AE2|nr:hypothetical protein [Pseudoxanthomonas sp. SGNA-20]RRN55988.1 hypothetical protein EIM48_10040 [Pseudoxanthomonas sp. SGNA-20]